MHPSSVTPPLLSQFFKGPSCLRFWWQIPPLNSHSLCQPCRSDNTALWTISLTPLVRNNRIGADWQEYVGFNENFVRKVSWVIYMEIDIRESTCPHPKDSIALGLEMEVQVAALPERAGSSSQITLNQAELYSLGIELSLLLAE